MTLETLVSLPSSDYFGSGARLAHYSQSIDLPSVALEATVNVDASVTGLLADDLPIAVVPPPGLNTNLQVTALGPVTAANTIRLRVENESAGAVDEAAATYHIVVLRKG